MKYEDLSDEEKAYLDDLQVRYDKGDRCGGSTAYSGACGGCADCLYAQFWYGKEDA